MLKNNNQDVEEWFRTYKRLADSNNWSIERKGKKLASFLRDRALVFWEEIPKKYRFDYEIVREVLIKKLSPDHTKSNAIEKFLDISQARGESVK